MCFSKKKLRRTSVPLIIKSSSELRPRKKNRMSEPVLQKNTIVPVNITDLSIFDDAFSTMKERFTAQMKQMEEEMARFSADLIRQREQTGTMKTGVPTHSSGIFNWEAIENSPLVQGEGESRALKLQFDVSQFEPSEIQVRILNDVLTVSAVHESKTDTRVNYMQYNREFVLPKGIDPSAVISSLSRDGVLTVQAPLPQIAQAKERQKLKSK